MKILVYILSGILLMIIESSFFSFLPIEFFKPDVGTPFIIYITLFLGPQAGLVAALLIGLFQEILSNSPHGSMVFTKIFIFLVAAFIKNKLYIDSKYIFSYICSGFVVIESFLFLILSILSKGETSNILNVTFYTIPNAVFTGLISIFIFSFLEHLDTRFPGKE